MSARRATPAPHAECRLGNGCSRHDWLVTTPVARSRTWPREPWGIVHVRGNGELLTACGVFAVGWPVFFDQTFDVEGYSSCESCASVVSLARLHRHEVPARSA